MRIKTSKKKKIACLTFCAFMYFLCFLCFICAKKNIWVKVACLRFVLLCVWNLFVNKIKLPWYPRLYHYWIWPLRYCRLRKQMGCKFYNHSCANVKMNEFVFYAIQNHLSRCWYSSILCWGFYNTSIAKRKINAL